MFYCMRKKFFYSQALARRQVVVYVSFECQRLFIGEKT
ncbi:hypothetical protein X474_19835 [Dethiosulfatarculus sandiegensis]|uniref:Uncharacterized protein n=1 Tax=Dethiosulfatarculus sandiegensis TaxID=1429043 RepID=A0A0D2GBK6_9BACT|nr:hypothetical protein X474_19835 [Dethiosulfatarculus sandiegensis]